MFGWLLRIVRTPPTIYTPAVGMGITAGRKHNFPFLCFLCYLLFQFGLLNRREKRERRIAGRLRDLPMGSRQG